MAKGKVPEIQVWKLRDKCRRLQAELTASMAQNDGLRVENARLRDALRHVPDRHEGKQAVEFPDAR